MNYNVIVRNIVEDGHQETPASSKEKAYFVLEHVFMMRNPRAVIITDARRLDLQKDNGCRPLIFKLPVMSDKRRLWRNINNVKLYNESTDRKLTIDMIYLPERCNSDSLLQEFLRIPEKKNTQQRTRSKSTSQFLSAILKPRRARKATC